MTGDLGVGRGEEDGVGRGPAQRPRRPPPRAKASRIQDCRATIICCSKLPAAGRRGCSGRAGAERAGGAWSLSLGCPEIFARALSGPPHPHPAPLQPPPSTLQMRKQVPEPERSGSGAGLLNRTHPLFFCSRHQLSSPPGCCSRVPLEEKLRPEAAPGVNLAPGLGVPAAPPAGAGGSWPVVAECPPRRTWVAGLVTRGLTPKGNGS